MKNGSSLPFLLDTDQNCLHAGGWCLATLNSAPFLGTKRIETHPFLLSPHLHGWSIPYLCAIPMAGCLSCSVASSAQPGLTLTSHRGCRCLPSWQIYTWHKQKPRVQCLQKPPGIHMVLFNPWLVQAPRLTGSSGHPWPQQTPGLETGPISEQKYFVPDALMLADLIFPFSF